MRLISIATLTRTPFVVAFGLTVNVGMSAFANESPPEPMGRPLKLTFENVDPEIGTLFVSVCTEPQIEARNAGEEYSCVGSAQAPAKNGAEVVFNDLPAGTYAATAFHDDNDNGQLDFDDRGIPFEATGNARNARGSYGPPTFAQMQFDLAPASEEPSPLAFTMSMYRVDVDF